MSSVASNISPAVMLFTSRLADIDGRLVDDRAARMLSDLIAAMIRSGLDCKLVFPISSDVDVTGSLLNCHLPGQSHLLRCWPWVRTVELW